MPNTRLGAKSAKNNPESTTATSKENMAAEAEDQPTLKAIFDMVKKTNTTVTTMEIRLKRLEEEGHPEITKLSTQINELTTSVNTYTDQITTLETTVKEQ